MATATPSRDLLGPAPLFVVAIQRPGRPALAFSRLASRRAADWLVRRLARIDIAASVDGAT